MAVTIKQYVGLGFSIVFILWFVSVRAVQAQDAIVTAEAQIQPLHATCNHLLADNQLYAALKYCNQAYLVYQQQHNLPEQVTTLHKIGQVYHSLLNPQAAVHAYSQALAILNTIEESRFDSLKADILYSWGLLSFERAQPDQAFSLLSQVVELSMTSAIELDTLGLSFYILGAIAEDQGNFSNAIDCYTQARSVFEQAFAVSGNEVLIDDQINATIAIGTIWARLGEFETATHVYTQALALNTKIESALRTSQILNNLGVLKIHQGNYAEALNFYHQALSIKESLGNMSSIGQTLHNMGNLYLLQGKLLQALSVLTQALEITPLEDIGPIINLKTTLAIVYSSSTHYGLAWENYHQALRLSVIGGERRRKIVAMVNLAKLMQQQKYPVLAIAFYKQAINDIEQTRDNLRSLPLETQQRYAETVADSYRELAALLLNQKRAFEAQQVLDLLKIQELEDYLHDVRAEQPKKQEKLPYLPSEKILLEQHQRLLLKNPSDTDSVLPLEAFLRHPEVAAALEILDRSREPAHQPDSLRQLQQKLQGLPEESAVLYPLVLEETLELLLVSSKGTPIHQTVSIDKEQLTEQVNQLRDALTYPGGDVRDSAASLYDVIIRPIQAELQNLNVKNIIYIPDSVLHYIPLSVLYDAAQDMWLVEHYTSHNLTASNIGDLTQPPRRPFKILAGAFADTNQTFEKTIDQTSVNFNGLIHAGHEVSFLKEQLPTTQVLSTQVLVNAEFSRDNLIMQFQGQNIVHLATHAAFVPGQPEDSFILLGDGDIITLKELRRWSWPNVDLVVLSACQTGISHIEEGLEILGMGFQVHRTEARAALASLWWVDDYSTSQLMQRFYTELAAGETKVQALQNAQRQLITNGRDEPYYWAPFVLIGNGL